MYIDKYTDTEIVNILNFIWFVQFTCEQYNIVCDLRDVRFVKTGNIRCAGWFSDGNGHDSNQPRLVAAMNRDDALEILTHEYCHLTQFVDGLSIWDVSGNSLEEIDNWLGGEYVEDIDQHIHNAIQLELDNEKRTAKCIKQWNLPIDTSAYTRKANAYLQFYLWMRHSRKWSSPNNSPYRNPRIVAAMKDTFSMDYTKLTPKLFALFEQEKI